MPAVSEDEAVRQQLDNILKSPGFARNDRLSRFLRFTVERHLERRYEDLKESVIGIEVFRRKADYDSKLDPVVRTEARRLRARLREYYNSVGADAAVVIDLPKGGYVPVMQLSSQVPHANARAQASIPRLNRKWHLPPLAVGGVIVILAAVGWTLLRPPLRPGPARNPAAYDLYLRARVLEMQRSLSGAELSIDLFEQAIATDSSFASAYAGLAAMEAARSAFDRFTPSERGQMIAKGWAAAKMAIRLDPRLADSYNGLAMMQSRQGQWMPAEQSFRYAIELSPRDPLWRNHFAIFLLLPLGRVQDAIDQLHTAEMLDPGLKDTHYALAVALTAIGRFDDAEFHCRKAAENDQQRSMCWVEGLIRQGKADEAIRMLETALDGRLLTVEAQFRGLAYARAGRREDAERIAGIVRDSATKARIFAALGDKDRTLEILNEWAPAGPTRIGRQLLAPEYAFLRGDARLNAFRTKIGLPQ